MPWFFRPPATQASCTSNSKGRRRACCAHRTNSRACQSRIVMWYEASSMLVSSIDTRPCRLCVRATPLDLEALHTPLSQWKAFSTWCVTFWALTGGLDSGLPAVVLAFVAPRQRRDRGHLRSCVRTYVFFFLPRAGARKKHSQDIGAGCGSSTRWTHSTRRRRWTRGCGRPKRGAREFVGERLGFRAGAPARRAPDQWGVYVYILST